MEQKLTAQDLQIGDWVMYNPNVFIEDEYVPTQESFPTQIKNGEDIDLVIEDCYAPILITPEILEKNGFEKIEEKYYRYFLEEKNYYESVRVYFDEEPNVQVRVLDGSEFKGRIKYLQQLQQTMRLCKIRKEIEL